MPGNERQFRIRQFAIDDVQVSTTNRAGADPDQNLAGLWRRTWNLGQPKRLSRPVENHRAHEAMDPHLPDESRAAESIERDARMFQRSRARVAFFISYYSFSIPSLSLIRSFGVQPTEREGRIVEMRPRRARFDCWLVKLGRPCDARRIFNENFHRFRPRRVSIQRKNQGLAAAAWP